ncbi:MAG: ExbD/TolR family protein [Polyangiales bacterium]
MSGQLSLRQRAYIRKQTKEVDLDPSEMEGELNIIPFLDIVVNLIMFLLMTTSAVAYFAQIELRLPEYGRGVGSRGAKKEEQPLNLSVTLTRSGAIVAGSNGKLAPGCDSVTSAAVVTVRKNAQGKYDWKGLKECAVKIKKAYSDEHQVTLSAEPLVPYSDVVAAMDAVRQDDEQELFPTVMLSAGVR